MKRSILTILAGICIATLLHAQQKPAVPLKEFTSDFDTRNCSFQPFGQNRFFILQVGYRLVLKGMEGKDTMMLVVTVTDSMKLISDRNTRVVEERETRNGKLTEISRNYFAFCRESGSVYCYGEDVDNYRDGKVVNHKGSWLAEADFLPGIAMPGIVLLGSRYYEEMAAGVAMDRAEVVSLNESLKTPAGTFPGCLKVEETSALDPKEKEYKYYAPGIGLIKDENMLLVSFGFVKQ